MASTDEVRTSVALNLGLSTLDGALWAILSEGPL